MVHQEDKQWDCWRCYVRLKRQCWERTRKVVMLWAAWDSKADSFTCEQVFNRMQSDIIYHCEWSNCSDSISLSGTVCCTFFCIQKAAFEEIEILVTCEANFLPRPGFRNSLSKVNIHIMGEAGFPFFTGQIWGIPKNHMPMMRCGTLNPHEKCTFCCVFFFSWMD